MSSRTRRSYDVISSLPDAIICHILSFLPTKQVVATSVLSKRWKHHWRSVPDIDLTDDQDVQQTDAIELDDRDSLSPFNEFVDSVLIKLDSIKSFRLKVGYNGSDLAYLGFPKVVDWLDQVVKRGVERILLTLFSGVGMKLPVSILNCKTLVELNLFSFNVKGFSSVRLPSLKILHLEECTFLNARDLVFLLAGCPILEDLHTFGIEFLSEDSLTYTECESLSLSKLTKAEMPFTYCHFPLKALHNVEKLHIEINQVWNLLLLYEHTNSDGIEEKNMLILFLLCF